MPASVLVGLALVACSGEASPGGENVARVSEAPTATQARVAPDLARLAEEFIAYAVGDAASFPHWESVSMAIGGEDVKSIDDLGAALSNRDIWKMCPADWEGYAAASCPVDLLGPLTSAEVNGAPLVYEPDYGEVTCAPRRAGPLPDGRLVVVRPAPADRTCATDFALALVADERGRLRSVDLTLSAP